MCLRKTITENCPSFIFIHFWFCIIFIHLSVIFWSLILLPHYSMATICPQLSRLTRKNYIQPGRLELFDSAPKFQRLFKTATCFSSFELIYCGILNKKVFLVLNCKGDYSGYISISFNKGQILKGENLLPLGTNCSL